MFLLLSGYLFFRFFEGTQGRFPAPFQFGGHQSVVGIYLVVLPLGQGRLVAQSLQLLLLCLRHLGRLLFLCRQGAGVDVQFDRR